MFERTRRIFRYNNSNRDQPDFTIFYYLLFRSTTIFRFPRNKVLALNASTVMTAVFFRCMEAMYGTSPDVVELSIWNYCSYYGNLVRIVVQIFS